MATFTQANSPLSVVTPLGPDALLLTGFSGQEELSRLFNFHLTMVAPRHKGAVPFEKILGNPVSVKLRQFGDSSKHRFFHGIVSRFSHTDIDKEFIHYRAEVVPTFWLLTKRTQSRIFQHKSIPDILKAVLQGLDVKLELQGTFEPRDYCVQYRESDFAFASRLMEEEGIFYFFKHTEGGHQMVLANSPQSHPDLPLQNKITFETIQGGMRGENRIDVWEKIQELRSGKTTLWDHSFELPHKHLEADKPIQDTVKAGTVEHKLAELKGVDKLELYDFPGGYAQRFDGIDAGGGDAAGKLAKVFDDNKRTVAIRMQQETTEAVVIHGRSNCTQMVSGHKFQLERHFDADGPYVLTKVRHDATMTGYRSGNSEMTYINEFHCIPLALPFRPARLTPRPTVAGSQSAVVVGPGGEEIFTDKYSRVKVQFHWDRQGKNDADSSCWIRVATHWAGKQWGIIHIPRIGQEVIVDFLEGDPDQPIIVGSVYNADQMPPYDLPGNKTQSGVKSRSSLGGSPANFNEIRFEDKKGAEVLTIHAEKDQSISVEHDESHSVGHDRSKTIGNDETTLVKHDRTETVDNNETITVHGARTETVDKDETITVHQNRTEKVDLNESITVGGNRTRMVQKAEAVTVALAQAITVGGPRAVTVGAAQAITVAAGQTITVGASQKTTVAKDDDSTIGANRSETVAKEMNSKIGGGRTASVANDDTLEVGKKLIVKVGEEIMIATGEASITMKKDGTITIKGKDILIDGSGKIDVKADKNITVKGQKVLQN